MKKFRISQSIYSPAAAVLSAQALFSKVLQASPVSLHERGFFIFGLRSNIFSNFRFCRSISEIVEINFLASSHAFLLTELAAVRTSSAVIFEATVTLCVSPITDFAAKLATVLSGHLSNSGKRKRLKARCFEVRILNMYKHHLTHTRFLFLLP